jgi:hypothetical protein
MTGPRDAKRLAPLTSRRTALGALAVLARAAVPSAAGNPPGSRRRQAPPGSPARRPVDLTIGGRYSSSTL